MLSRDSDGSGWSNSESWEWDDASNVCLRYEGTEKEEAPPQFQQDGTKYNEVEIVRTVPYFNADISEYRIHQVETTKEWSWEINAAGTAYEPQLITVAREITDIERFADGSGTKTVDNEEAAKGKYWVKFQAPAASVDPDIQEQIFAYNELVQDTREKTIYRKRGNRTYALTNRYRPYLRVLSIYPLMGTIALVKDGGEFSNEEPELPEMEEAIKTISAEVEYAEAWDTELGVYERQETLPDIPIPKEILTDEALYNWLYQRAIDYAKFKKKSSMLIDEMTIRTSLNHNVDVRQSINGFTVTSVQHSLSSSTAGTTIVGTKPSAQTVPRKSQIGTGALIVSTMKRFDSEQDNVRAGTVIKPVSSVRAMVMVNGKTYIVDNPNSGMVHAGDSIAVLRATGKGVSGRVG
jgi:hypothetical protein